MWNAKPRDVKIVLVVDDDPFVRKGMSELLDAKGYSVLQAERGQKAPRCTEENASLPMFGRA
jgi:CheY-like chemotaxis protein